MFIRKTIGARVAALTIVVMLGLAGCAANGSSQAGQSASSVQTSSDCGGGSSNSSAQGQRLASSLDDYICQVSTWKDISEKQRKILQEARAAHGVTTAQYERAWSDFRTCLINRGYKSFDLIKFPNGVYKMPLITTAPTEAQQEKYHSDYTDCLQEEVMGIDAVFNKQVANPSLYREPEDGVADCLRRENLVPKDYTADTLRKEHSARKYEHFNIRDMRVRGCFAANDWNVNFADEEAADIW